MAALLSRLELAVPAGAIAAALFIFAARRVARRGELRAYGVGLIVAPLVYVFFGICYAAPARHLAVEAAGAVIYIAAAVAGLKRWPALLALGWATHIAWDLFLHHAAGPTFAPEWYPLLCGGFDLFLGGYIAGLVRSPASAAN
jgi:hypothetical protein